MKLVTPLKCVMWYRLLLMPPFLVGLPSSDYKSRYMTQICVFRTPLLWYWWCNGNVFASHWQIILYPHLEMLKSLTMNRSSTTWRGIQGYLSQVLVTLLLPSVLLNMRYYIGWSIDRFLWIRSWVLILFRKEPIARMAGIESMFYQVCVPQHHQNLLRVLWWENNNIDCEPSDH